MHFDAYSADDGDGTSVLSSSHIIRQSLGTEKAHYLVIVRGGEKSARFEVTQTPKTFGRSDTADVQLMDGGISKIHCRVQLSLQGDLVLTDLNSTNGTFVDGLRIRGSVILPTESVMQIGQHVLKHEYRWRSETDETDQLALDLQRAIDYVRSILPPPYRDEAIEVDWTFIPSAHLGGDALGYHAIDDNTFAFYLLDVCGHGASAALHSVSAINILRHQSLLKTDFASPKAVLEEMNNIFQMDKHADMYFTMWFGVYRRRERTLTYASAGHPPAILVSQGDEPFDLRTPGLPIGSMPSVSYEEKQTIVEPGSVLYVFSDGVYEVQTPEGEEWSLGQFRAILPAGEENRGAYAQSVRNRIVAVTRSDKCDDDFSLMAVRFS